MELHNVHYANENEDYALEMNAEMCNHLRLHKLYLKSL